MDFYIRFMGITPIIGIPYRTKYHIEPSYWTTTLEPSLSNHHSELNYQIITPNHHIHHYRTTTIESPLWTIKSPLSNHCITISNHHSEPNYQITTIEPPFRPTISEPSLPNYKQPKYLTTNIEPSLISNHHYYTKNHPEPPYQNMKPQLSNHHAKDLTESH